ncbi:MAG: hypothetical protein KatS3mg118_3328 [Paracoccaceae bacterium]|nr:MAG: FAD-dependent oxidoreductase [Alphaproteobacteria bacterium]GIX15369.1 MAG: hypothetical protein KatS3mg118_3328 [Paracoccaceae bacterium]
MSHGRPVNPATRIVRMGEAPPARLIEVDLCVVGAGISGSATALEAARLGLSVALVDGLPALGGQAVNSIIGTFCGLYRNGTHGHRFTFGVADDILEALQRENACHFRHGPMTTVVHYDEIVLSRILERMIDAAGIIPLVGATLHGVRRDGNRVEEALFVTRWGDVRIRARGFADCSGDAALTYQAGFACREPEEPIYGSQQAVIEGIRLDRPLPSREEISARIAERAEAYGLIRRNGLIFTFPGRDVAVLNMTHVETPLDPIAASRTGLIGKDQVDRGVQLLRDAFPEALGDIRVRAYGFPGIRQTRWIKGRHQITADEVRAGVRYPDAIARTAWPIELHNAPEGFVWEVFDEDHVHYVPLSAMIPEEAENIIAVGRCIDGDPAALSSVRVMGPCIAMGAAAAHAFDLAGSGSVQQIDIARLQERLSDNLTRTDGVAP